MSDQTFGVVCLIALVLIAIALIVPIGLICTPISTDPSRIDTYPINLDPTAPDAPGEYHTGESYYAKND